MTTEIPDDKLADLLINEAKANAEVDVYIPTHFADHVEKTPWEWLNEAKLFEVEADFDNYDHVIVHLQTGTGYHKKKYEATRTDPAAYEYIPCKVNIAIWWDLDVETQPELNIEVHEE